MNAILCLSDGQVDAGAQPLGLGYHILSMTRPRSNVTHEVPTLATALRPLPVASLPPPRVPIWDLQVAVERVPIPHPMLWPVVAGFFWVLLVTVVK